MFGMNLFAAISHYSIEARQADLIVANAKNENTLLYLLTTERMKEDYERLRE